MQMIGELARAIIDRFERDLDLVMEAPLGARSPTERCSIVRGAGARPSRTKREEKSPASLGGRGRAQVPSLG